MTVEIFDDRAEIGNPGGLVSAIDQADFGTCSHSRNPLIFGLFNRMNMVEQIGSGISRMNKLMNEAALPQPEYRIKGMFTVIFKRPVKTVVKPDDTVVKTVEEIIFQLIRMNSKASSMEMAEATNLTIRGVEYQLNKLKNSGKIERVGPANGGYWRITD
ncbi:ATP-binding protein [Pedobacter sp. L105]|uniref:ATP-binding protein n=1 Tax=Pedobacter sp. L105 TaxID=1641871 RepID=UPI002110257A|nr:ATP-binding protein [Pedobacter sp. L105]